MQLRVRWACLALSLVAAGAPDKIAWNAISAQQKLRVLEFLIKREIDRAMPELLGPVPAKR